MRLILEKNANENFSVLIQKIQKNYLTFSFVLMAFDCCSDENEFSEKEKKRNAKKSSYEWQRAKYLSELPFTEFKHLVF